jgi:ribosome biogenesis GTPase / thiamine phosphate phosphatase
VAFPLPMALEKFGWDNAWAATFAALAPPGAVPARVICELRRKFYDVQLADREALAECTPGFFHHATRPDEWPAVGDWLAVTPHSHGRRVDVQAVLPRRTKFSRRAAGEEDIEQILAANIDTVFLVSGLDRNHNPARLQRFLVAARRSGAAPAIILNKADLHPDAAAVQAEVAALMPGVPVLLTTAHLRRSLATLRPYLRPGHTLAFLGSSGVGKSSLVNALVRDEFMPVGEVRDKDSKGRHTTTRRELVATPSGALIIDTPGLREIQLWDAAEGIDEAFADILTLATRCRFTNCTHEREPGCAVQAALGTGELAPARLAAYRKLQPAAKPAPDRRPRPGANRVKHRKLNAERDAWRKHLDG